MLPFVWMKISFAFSAKSQSWIAKNTANGKTEIFTAAKLHLKNVNWYMPNGLIRQWKCDLATVWCSPKNREIRRDLASTIECNMLASLGYCCWWTMITCLSDLSDVSLTITGNTALYSEPSVLSISRCIRSIIDLINFTPERTFTVPCNVYDSTL